MLLNSILSSKSKSKFKLLLSISSIFNSLEENFIGDSFKIQYKNNSFLNINFDKQEQTNPKLDNQNTENKKINELVKNKKLEKNINK